MKTRKAEVVDNYHGHLVADPYRWLEEMEAPEVKAWTEGQNRLTQAYLAGSPVRGQIKARLTELWDFPKYSLPQKAGGRYFYTKNDGLQNQPVLCGQDGLAGEPFVVMDPNEFSEDGTIALTGTGFSKDGKMLAYARSASGSDWQEIRVRRVDTGEEYPEVLRWVKFTNLAWTPDNQGFFYTRFPDPSMVAPEETSYYSKVCYHRIGTDQAADEVVYERPDAREFGFSADVSEDGRYIVITVWVGTDRKNRVYYRELGSDGPFIHLLDDHDAKYTPLGNIDSTMYFQTDLDAPKGRIIAIDLAHPARENWREIIPEAEQALDYAELAGGRLVVVYLRDAQHEVKVFDLTGCFEHEIQLPEIGTVLGFSSKIAESELFLVFTSYLTPNTVFRYDLETRELSPFKKISIPFRADDYETHQVFVRSKDGIRVPMFIVHRKGLKLDGNNPTLVYGYGGFAINQTPGFALPFLAWMERGGVYASVCLRGGAEYGEEWHRAGMLENKQNVFNDFISACEWLIENKYTQRGRLAIMGGSNGGLLVSACMNQRPDLFGAVICRVPVTDMLRYHKFTVGRYWIGEYGNAEASEEQFRYMYAYSPLHTVKPGTAYPPIMIMTADTDDRVVPLHSFKYAATLQEAQAGDNPVLLRVEAKAGHGAGKPTSKIIDEMADIYAFLFKVMGIS